MDIQSISHYLRQGYRVKRSDWKVYYLELSPIDNSFVKVFCKYVPDMGKDLKFDMVNINPLSIDDLIANDWEIIYDGVSPDNTEWLVKYV
jgi:hypothetical protein